MKIKTIILTAALFFTFQTAFAQTEREVAEIRRQVTTINNNLKKYKKETKDVEALSTEGAEANFYTSSGDINKIAAKIYGETFNATTEFYYNDGKLIFVFYRLNRYNRPIGVNVNVKAAKIEEKRLYFAGEKMVKLLVGKIDVKSGSKQWKESEKDMTELSAQLRKQL